MKTLYLAKMIAQEPMGQGFPEGQRCFGGVWSGVTHCPDNVAKRGSRAMERLQIYE
jgi:hypothetical protein